MAKKDIYKIDNYCITIGIVLLVFGTIATSGITWLPTLIQINGLIVLGVGIFYRVREKKIISIWNALEQTGSVRVNDLVASLGHAREFILKYLKDINAQQGAYYVWDQGSDKVVDAKLMKEILIVADCAGCGSKVNEKISLNFTSLPSCRYCGNPVASAENLNQLRREVMGVHQVMPDKKELNMWLFVGLMVMFWPAAIYYVYSVKSQSTATAS